VNTEAEKSRRSNFPLRGVAATGIGSRTFILSYLGSVLTAVGALMLLPLIPLWVYHESARHAISVFTFLLPAAAALTLGLILQKKIPLRTPSVSDAMVITALGWFVICLVGAVPFMIGLHKSFIDALFESVSGFTTTGITVFEGLDAMPRCILFWRSFIQWIGGLGILTFFLAVTFRGGSASATLFGAEGHKIGSARPVPGIFHTVRVLWGIYILFTVAGFAVFRLGGQSGFDALNHSLTCISTGGFSPHDESIGYYAAHRYAHAGFIEYATIFFMLAGGMNFLVHYRVLRGRIGTLVRDFEMRWFWAIIIFATALIMMDHYIHHPLKGAAMGETPQGVLRASLFQVSSLITSTGFATKDINTAFFSALGRQIFFMLMVVGGCVGSTAGGIKVLRLGILVEMFKTQLFRITAPRRAASAVVVRGKIISSMEIERIGSLFCNWLMLIAAGAGITALFSDLNAWQALSGMASAVGNMGPFFFSVHKMASLSWVIKATYVMGMLAGRLEILPIAILFSRAAWK